MTDHPAHPQPVSLFRGYILCAELCVLGRVVHSNRRFRPTNSPVSTKDFGIFIAVGGFKKNARDFAFGKRNLKLIDGDGLVELVYKYYDRLDGKYKGILPLRRVFIPETLGE